MLGFRQKWLPPSTPDEYMYEVQHNLWWDQKDRAKRQLLWLMDRFLGDSGEEETALSQGSGFEKETGEDDSLYTVGRRYSD